MKTRLVLFSVSVYITVLMQTVQKAMDLIGDTEAKLRDLVSEAATAGDYGGVLQIAAWARTISELVKGTGKALQSATPRPTGKSNGKPSKQVGHPTSRVPHSPKSYPLFFRHEDELVRLAWSKREKKEYRHKAPQSVLKALTKAIAEKGTDGRVFSTDVILPIHGSGNSEVPNYQAYVGIALLKQTGLIDQHGRQGYSIPRPADFRESVEAVWRNLPELQNP